MRTHTPDSVHLDALEPRLFLAGDHPSLANFPSATQITLVDNPQIESSVAQMDGVIGFSGDDDLFSFVAPYSGRTAITVAQLNVGGLAPAIRLYDDAGAPLSELHDGRNGVAAVMPIPLTNIVEGERYYINVRAGQPSDTNEPMHTGGYRVVIVMEIPPGQSKGGPDGLPVELTLDGATGEADLFGFIVDDAQTDTFGLTTLAPGLVSVSVTTPGSDLWPSVRVFDASMTLIASATGSPESARVEFVAGATGQRYFIEVSADTSVPWSVREGAYRLLVTGAVNDEPVVPPVDLRLSSAEIDGALPLPIDLLTGLAETLDAITGDADSDVFTFRALRSGHATVGIRQLNDAETFAGTLGVFRGADSIVAFSSTPTEGWLARVTFEVTVGQDYFVRVRTMDGSAGAYTLKLAAPLAEHLLFYPEGYSSGTVDEYVPITNPNSFPVNYVLIARYEVGDRDEVVAAGVVPANSRGGVTITSRRTPGASLVRPDTPYALELRSDGPLGATLSHYDFGVTTGESFTSRPSTAWVFAEARRDADTFRDFLVFYNPNPAPTSVRVTLTYDDGEVVSFTRPLEAHRRGGVNFTTDTALTRDGVFSIQVHADQPIVAAVSSYDIVEQRGYGLLGAAGRASTRGAIPLLAAAPGARPTLAIFNPSGVASTVTLTTSILGVGNVSRDVSVQPGARVTLSAADLGLHAEALAGLRYHATVPVVVTSSEYHTGDGDATAAGTEGASTALIADAFVNPDGAGSTYRELLGIHNPLSSAAQVSVTLLRDGGVLDSIVVNVGPLGFAFVRVDQMPGVLNSPGPVAFSVRIDSSAPVISAFAHYDLYLDGGWGALGAPLGLTTPLDAL